MLGRFAFDNWMMGWALMHANTTLGGSFANLTPTPPNQLSQVQLNFTAVISTHLRALQIRSSP